LLRAVNGTKLAGWEILAAGGAAFLGLVLRLVQYTTVPFRAPNPDEWNWSWSGLSQILGMPPTAWTLFFDAYPRSVWAAPPPPYTEPLVHPWVDAPPLFSWLIGFAAWVGGDRTINDVISDPRPRLIGIALSVVAIALAYLLGRAVFGTLPALVGVWLLAVSPIPVVLDRLVAAEQLLAVLLLLALLAVLHLRSDPDDRRWERLLLLCCALAPAVKAPGLVVGASAVLLLAGSRHYRLAGLAGGAALAGQILAIGYDAALNWQAYSGTVAIRGSELSGYTGFRFITNTTGFDRQQAFDGWWLLGWLGVAELLGRRRPNFDLVAAPAVVYLLILLGTAAAYSSGYGWYRLTIMPLIYLAAGRFLWLAALELSWVRLALAAVLAIATWQNFAAPMQVSFHATLIAVLVGLAVLPALAVMARPAVRHWARYGAFALLVALVPLGIAEVAEAGFVFGHL